MCVCVCVCVCVFEERSKGNVAEYKLQDTAETFTSRAEEPVKLYIACTVKSQTQEAYVSYRKPSVLQKHTLSTVGVGECVSVYSECLFRGDAVSSLDYWSGNDWSRPLCVCVGESNSKNFLFTSTMCTTTLLL